MEHAACNVIYVHKKAKEQVVQRASFAGTDILLPNGVQTEDSKLDHEVIGTIESILSAFTTGKQVIAKVFRPEILKIYSSRLLFWGFLSFQNIGF